MVKGILPYDHDPVVMAYCRGLGGGEWGSYSLLAFLAGVALVDEKYDDMQVYARRSRISAFTEFIPKWHPVSRWPSLMDSLNTAINAIALHIRHDFLMVPVREDRLQLNRVQHLIAEHHPELRDFDAPSPPEVTLRPLGGLRLGGICDPKFKNPMLTYGDPAPY